MQAGSHDDAGNQGRRDLGARRGGRQGGEPVAAERPDPEEADGERGGRPEGAPRRRRDLGERRYMEVRPCPVSAMATEGEDRKS
nr:unnamed protein product [Digitaria exilis]